MEHPAWVCAPDLTDCSRVPGGRRGRRSRRRIVTLQFRFARRGQDVNCKRLFAVHIFSRFSKSLQALRNWLKSRVSLLNRSKAIIC